MAKVSIIIPAYNQGHYLAEAIQSCLKQTYQELEVIVVDDGSTDDTAEVAQSYIDPRLRYIYQENRGLSGARNTGIRHAVGSFLTYLDSDDLFLPQKLTLLVEALNNDPALGFVAGQAILIDEASQPLGEIFESPIPDDLTDLLLGNPLHVGSVMIRREWQEKVGFFDESLRSYEDWDMWLRLARAGCQMGWVPQPVSLYRFHANQMTRDGSQMTTATFAVLDKLFNEFDLVENWRAMRDKAYSRAYLRAAAQSYRVRSFADGKDNLAQAVMLAPDLLADNGDFLANQLVAWTDLPKIADPFGYLKDIYHNLPPELALLERRRNRYLGRMAMQMAYEAFDQGDMQQARTAVRHAVRYQPGWLKNRGALAIFLRSHLAFLN